MKVKNQRADKPKIDRKIQDESKTGRFRDPRVSVPWGRSASEYRPGKFIKKYFSEHSEACAADIYHALGDEIISLNEDRVTIGEKPLRRPNYSSFSRYFHWFEILGLIEHTGKTEPAIYKFLREKVFYRLTEKGKAESKAWLDPVAATHPEFR